MDIEEILGSLEKGKISSNTAKKLLSLYSIEKIEDIAKIDVNRRKRRGIENKFCHDFQNKKRALSKNYFIL
ncbi:MAG: hypothetical protein P8X83_01105 [Nitrosopumilaceae archaeon]